MTFKRKFWTILFRKKKLLEIYTKPKIYFLEGLLTIIHERKHKKYEI